jgi:hypothetical protein
MMRMAMPGKVGSRVSERTICSKANARAIRAPFRIRCIP